MNDCVVGLLDPEAEGITVLQNVGSPVPNNAELHSRRLELQSVPPYVTDQVLLLIVMEFLFLQSNKEKNTLCGNCVSVHQ